jgi:KDO2-lipid IV(A) lauroyltransferase
MAPPLRKRVKRALRSVLLRAAVRVLALLPLRSALAVGRVAGTLAWWLAPGQRQLVLEHLALAFPSLPAEERRALGKASMVQLGEVAMEIVASASGRIAIEQYVSLAPGAEETIRRAMSRGKGAIFIGAHTGNFEFLARRIATLAQPNAVIARRNADEKLNELMARFRQAGGYQNLWRDDSATGREIIRLFRRGGALGMLIDQDTRVQGVFVPFFGRLAFTPRAAGDLALRFGAAVLVVTSHRRGPGPGAGHEIELVELPYDPTPADREAEVQRITAAAVALQEQAIRRYPAEWVWMHRRWKTRPPSECSQANTVPKSRELSGT